MRSSTVTRLVAAGATVVLAGLGLVGVASALEGEKLSIKAENGPPVKQSYGRMVVNDASSEFSGDPETCKSLPWCTVIPMEVILPAGYDPEIQEFTVKVTLEWDDAPVADGAAQGNDLDLYVFDVSGTEDYDEDGEKDEVFEVARSAGSSMPEVAPVFQPDNGAYEIVVYNWVGINNGFSVTLEFLDARVEEVDDFAEEPAGPKLSAGSEEDFVPEDEPVVDEGDEEIALPEPTDAGEPASDPLAGEEFGLFGDDEFNFDDDAAPEVDAGVLNALGGRRAALGPPKPVSGAVLVAWMGFGPIAIAAGAFFFLWRRRPAALSMDFRGAA